MEEALLLLMVSYQLPTLVPLITMHPMRRYTGEWWIIVLFHSSCHCILILAAHMRLFSCLLYSVYYSKASYHTPSFNALTNTSKNGCVSDAVAKILTQFNAEETELYRWYMCTIMICMPLLGVMISERCYHSLSLSSSLSSLWNPSPSSTPPSLSSSLSS